MHLQDLKFEIGFFLAAQFELRLTALLAICYEIYFYFALISLKIVSSSEESKFTIVPAR